MSDLEILLAVTSALATLGVVFTMIENNQQKTKFKKEVDRLKFDYGLKSMECNNLREILDNNNEALDGMMECAKLEVRKILELTDALNNSQEQLLALQDKAIAKKAAEKKATVTTSSSKQLKAMGPLAAKKKAPAKKAAPKKSKKG
jgi:hypothetical protein